MYNMNDLYMNQETILDYCIYSDIDDDFCSQPSSKLNGFCDGHQNCVTNIQPFINKEKELCVKTIKTYFTSLEATTGRINRGNIIAEIFEFISKHKGFIFNHKNLANTLLVKLYEWENDTDVINTQKYIREIFPLLFTENNNKINKEEQIDNNTYDYNDTIQINI